MGLKDFNITYISEMGSNVLFFDDRRSTLHAPIPENFFRESLPSTFYLKILVALPPKKILMLVRLLFTPQIEVNHSSQKCNNSTA